MDFDDFSFPENRVAQRSIEGANIGSAWDTNLELFLSQTPIANTVRMIERELEPKSGETVSKEVALEELAAIPGAAESAIQRNLVSDKGLDRTDLDRMKFEADLFYARSISARNATNGFGRSTQALLAGLAAEAVDPMNLVVGAGIGAAMKTGKVALATTRMSRIMQAARIGALEGAAGEVAVLPVRFAGASYGDTYHLSESAADIAFGGLFGGLIRGVGRGVVEITSGKELNDLLRERVPEEAADGFQTEFGATKLPELESQAEQLANLDPKIREDLTRVIIAQAAAGRKDLHIDSLVMTMVTKGIEEKRARALASGLSADYNIFLAEPAVARVINSARITAESERSLYRDQIKVGLESRQGSVDEWFNQEINNISNDLFQSNDMLGTAVAEQRLNVLAEMLDDMESLGLDARADLEGRVEFMDKAIQEEVIKRFTSDDRAVNRVPTDKEISDALRIMTGKSKKQIEPYLNELYEARDQLNARVDQRTRDLSADQLGELYGAERMGKSDFYTWMDGSDNLKIDAENSPSAEFVDGIMTEESARKLEEEASETAYIQSLQAELDALAPGLSSTILKRNNDATARQVEAQNAMIEEFVNCKLGVPSGQG